MSDTDRLERLEQELAAIHEKMKAEKKRIREKEKRDTQRRRLLTGAICLEQAGKDPDFKTRIDQLLIRHVPEADRYLWPELFTSVAENGEVAGTVITPAHHAESPE